MSKVCALLLKPVTMKVEQGEMNESKPIPLNEVTPRPGNVLNEYETPKHERVPCFPECNDGVNCEWPSCKSPGNAR